VMKPKPFESLNHFTVPVAMLLHPSANASPFQGHPSRKLEIHQQKIIDLGPIVTEFVIDPDQIGEILGAIGGDFCGESAVLVGDCVVSGWFVVVACRRLSGAGKG
jgi:hypothetical protein